MSDSAVHGEVADRFRPVADVFGRHLSSGADVGAALCVYVDGIKKVDVWGGLADPVTGKSWKADTLAPVFSCSKGVLTICLLMLVDDGRVDVKAPVADYWPEFARNGKEGVTVEDVLSHQAGLALLDAPLTLGELLDWKPVIAALEKQRLQWKPGTAHAYHAVTFGWLVGEIVRRVTGETPGEFLQSTLAGPLALETWIGLPASEHHRVAPLIPSPPEWTDPALVNMVQSYLSRDDRVLRAVTMNGALRVPFPGVGTECDLNEPAVWSAEIPAGNCITTARSLAKLYAATLGTVDGHGPLLSAGVRADATNVRSQGEQYFGLPGAQNAWGLGFQLANPMRPMLGPSSFGHDGAGGEIAFADQESGIGFAYVHNQMGGIPDLRGNDLVDAVRTCL